MRQSRTACKSAFTIKNRWAAPGKQLSQTPKEPRAIVRVVIPFEDQESANYVKKELKNLSIKVQTTIQPVFFSCKIDHRSSTASFIVFNVTCVIRVMWAIRADTHTYVDGHKQKASSIYKHHHEQQGEVPKDLLRRFSILKKSRNKFDCLVNEMLFINKKYKQQILYFTFPNTWQ